MKGCSLLLFCSNPNFSQLSILLRYIKTDASIEERFIVFKKVSANHIPDASYDVLYNFKKEFNDNQKLIVQSGNNDRTIRGSAC